MADKTIRIRGVVSGDPRAQLNTSEVEIVSRRSVRPGGARDADAAVVKAKPDELVRVELDNGFVLWSRVDDFVSEHGRAALSRDGTSVFEVSNLKPVRAPQQRGALGLGIKVLDFFGVNLKGLAAKGLGEAYERSRLAKSGPGLYRCSLGDTFALEPKQQIPVDSGPLLVFIHGTGSSSERAFGGLWKIEKPEGRNARQRLHTLYGDRVFAFEHLTLSQSPIANAFDLVSALPESAEIHLVTHSRGGLIGELLALGECANLDSVLTRQTLGQLFAADRIMGEQLGLAPLDKKEADERDAKYKEDRERLAQLVVLLLEKKLKVRRFVRVACPALGTTLASGRLDRWLSVLSSIAGMVDQVGVASDVLDFLLAVVKERTDPRTLPGLEAQMPGSALTRLLHHPDLKTASDLSAIAGDIEGDSIWDTVKLLVTDWFYGADHDLVVNTGSMLGGLAREEGAARHRVDRGEDVNHSAYFVNPQSVRWLVAGLTRADTDQAGFVPIAAADPQPPKWRSAVQASRDATAVRPLAVVLPGTMGSHLQSGGNHIWLKYLTLLRGGLKRLGINERDVEPLDLLDEFYGPLLEFLAASHRVEIFPYDWRRSVRDAAAKLAKKLEEWLPQAERDRQPVHIVAHSMGGLVVRAMIGDGGRGTRLWERVLNLPNSRFLMLGTPNAGSYEAVRWLTGFNPTQAKLALLDFTQSTDDLATLAGTYPGLLELLPFGLDDQDYLSPAFWQELKQRTGAGWSPPAEVTLRAARGTLEALRNQTIDARSICYVAGTQPATVIGYKLTDYRKPSDHKRLEFSGTPEGDGTVPWKSGELAGVPMWYVADTAHDALCAQRSAFAGYLDLLTTGKTRRLLDARPSGTRDAAGAPERFPMPQSPPADCIPRESDTHLLGFGGGRDGVETEGRSSATIDVSIRHGSLAYVRHPVMVGHYAGDTIVSAEAFLDRQLGGELSRRAALGLYPGRHNTHAIFIRPENKVKPAGAIVVGLGDVGDLTPSLLEQGVCTALLDYALRVAQWPDDRFGKAETVRSAAVSCCLIGTGAGQLQVRSSIESILRAAIKANDRLDDANAKVTIDRLEFVEIYEDVALTALAALRRVLAGGSFENVRWTDQTLASGSGGQRRVRFEEAQEWWQRLEITEDEHSPDVLRFSLIGDRARTEESLSLGQLALAERFIWRASSSAARNDEISRTLFEMLLPLRLKQTAPRQRDMVLLVDETSARYPWELLEDRWSTSDRPPSVRAGFLRQLKAATFRPRPAFGAGLKALVIGHPDLEGWTKFSDLPGARREAEKAAEVLRELGYEVFDCIDEKVDQVLNFLHRDAWRVLHLAAHGVHEFTLDEDDLENAGGSGKSTKRTKTVKTAKAGQDEDTERVVSGMVIGKGTVLTPGDIRQMRWVPELVFINCCHLGRTQAAYLTDRSALAANIGVEFIRMGSRAVVVAGWAVDDGAALAFAETFYRCMLDGQMFGEAVRAAREEIWRRFPGANTWGAYQCYGDPNYRLKRDGDGAQTKSPNHGSFQELVTALENLASSLRVSDCGDDDDIRARDGIDAMHGAIPTDLRDAWLKRADVCAAFGFARGELRDWKEAIEWLDKAIAAGKGACPIRAVEQCANFKVRLAAEEWLRKREELGKAAKAEIDRAREPFVKTIEGAILELDILCKRAANGERLALLGSACKRLAMVHDNVDRRKEALINMANYYDLAFAKNSNDAYPLTNWATAQLLLLRLDKGASREWQARLDADVRRVLDALDQRYENEPDFWDGASIADLHLVQLLDRCLGAVPFLENAWCDEGDERIAEIRTRYLGPIRRGASARTVSSIIENLDFVVAMLDGPTNKRLREALIGIRSDLRR